MMSPFYWVYASLAVALAGLEVYGVWFRPADKDTISEFLGYLFRANTVAGWWALMLTFGALAAWFPQHARRLDQRNRAAVARDADDKP